MAPSSSFTGKDTEHLSIKLSEVCTGSMSNCALPPVIVCICEQGVYLPAHHFGGRKVSQGCLNFGWWGKPVPYFLKPFKKASERNDSNVRT